MNRIALQMLAGDRAKHLGILFGVTVAALLIAQQASIFCGVMRQTASLIRDVEAADIWVMDPHTGYINDVKPLTDTALHRVRGLVARDVGTAAVTGAEVGATTRIVHGPGRVEERREEILILRHLKRAPAQLGRVVHQHRLVATLEVERCGARRERLCRRELFARYR